MPRRSRTALAAGLLALALAGPGAAQGLAPSFLACRFPAGGQLRVAIEPQAVAVAVPGRPLWLEAEEIISRRDPVVAGFAATLPGEGWGRAPAHDRFALSLSRMSGEAVVLLSRRPDQAQVEQCRQAAAAATPAAPGQPPSLPVPCEVPVSVGSIAGTCEVQRPRF